MWMWSKWFVKVWEEFESCGTFWEDSLEESLLFISCPGCLQLSQLCFLMRCQNNWKVSCVASHVIREWSNNLSVRMLRVFDTYRYWISIVQFYIVWLCVDIEHWCFIMYDLFKILPLIWWAVIVIDLVLKLFF